MWFEDLTPLTYIPVDAKLIAVGWLDREHAYPSGDVDRAVYTALVEMLKNPWQPGAFGGWHDCNLCRYRSESRGSSNLFIPFEGQLFVAPEMIAHYMNAHGYRPPDVFCQAVLTCPRMRSMDYLRAVKACGGAKLL